MEYWNIGFNKKIKKKNFIIPIIPTFHHSIKVVI